MKPHMVKFKPQNILAVDIPTSGRPQENDDQVNTYISVVNSTI